MTLFALCYAFKAFNYLLPDVEIVTALIGLDAYQAVFTPNLLLLADVIVGSAGSSCDLL